MRTAAKWLVGALALIGCFSVVGLIFFASKGLSSRPEPPPAEVVLARAVRHFLIPSQDRALSNPLAGSEEVLRSARAHWADHCASCHGNDGKGATTMGRGLYPKAPDMTLPATQLLSDGELFWIIENGIKLTGMPAWGTPNPQDDGESWELVHFIRHLPALSAADIAEMQRLNPISRPELEEMLEMERFLAGDDLAPREKAGPRIDDDPH